MAAGLMFAGVSANAAPAKKAPAKSAKSAKAAAPKAKVKATTKYVFPSHTLGANEKSALNYYMRAFNNYNDGKPKTALQDLDLCDKALGYASSRSSYLRAKISYELADYNTARNAVSTYLKSNPVKDQGYAEMLTINDALSAYFTQQSANKEAAEAAAAAAAQQAAAAKKAEKEKELADIASAREKREEARKNMSGIIAKIKGDLEAARQANTRAAYQQFIEDHPFGISRNTAEKEMLEKWPYPERQLKNGKYGYVDAKGKTVVKPKYDNALPFENDLARVGKDSKYGFVNEQGKEVIPCKFKSASSFSYGYAAVKDQTGAYFIDKTGAKMGTATYKDIRPFSEGLAAVSNSTGNFGYIDKSGKQVVDFKYAVACPFSAGRAAVGKKEGKTMKYAYIKKDGSMLTDFIFDEAQNFQAGVARIKQNGKFGLIDFAGSQITVIAYDFITDFRADGYARARRNGVDVLIDRNGDNWSEVNGNIIPVKFKN